jgi:hypothetical protein
MTKNTSSEDEKTEFKDDTTKSIIKETVRNIMYDEIAKGW